MPFPVTFVADRSLHSFGAYHASAGAPAIPATLPAAAVGAVPARTDAHHDAPSSQGKGSSDRQAAAPSQRTGGPPAPGKTRGDVARRDAIDRLALWPAAGRGAFTVSVEQLAAAAAARSAPFRDAAEANAHVVITVDGGRYLLPVEGAAILPPPPPPEEAATSDEAADESATLAAASGQEAAAADGGVDAAVVERRHQEQLTTGLTGVGKTPHARSLHAHKAYDRLAGPRGDVTTSAPVEAARRDGWTLHAPSAPAAEPRSSSVEEYRAKPQALAAYAHTAAAAA